jgi:hypothetical protein
MAALNPGLSVWPGYSQGLKTSSGKVSECLFSGNFFPVNSSVLQSDEILFRCNALEVIPVITQTVKEQQKAIEDLWAEVQKLQGK